MNRVVEVGLTYTFGEVQRRRRQWTVAVAMVAVWKWRCSNRSLTFEIMFKPWPLVGLFISSRTKLQSMKKLLLLLLLPLNCCECSASIMSQTIYDLTGVLRAVSR